MNTKTMYFRAESTVKPIGSQELSTAECAVPAKVAESGRQSTENLSQPTFLRHPVAFKLQIDTNNGTDQQVMASSSVESGSSKATGNSLGQLGVALRNSALAEMFSYNSLNTICTVHRGLRRQFGIESMVINFCNQLNELSTREVDVLLLTIEGRTLKEISARLKVGIATIAKHRASAFKKLSVRNSTELYYLLDAVFEFLTRQCHETVCDSSAMMPAGLRIQDCY